MECYIKTFGEREKKVAELITVVYRTSHRGSEGLGLGNGTLHLLMEACSSPLKIRIALGIAVNLLYNI